MKWVFLVLLSTQVLSAFAEGPGATGPAPAQTNWQNERRVKGGPPKPAQAFGDRKKKNMARVIRNYIRSNNAMIHNTDSGTAEFTGTLFGDGSQGGVQNVIRKEVGDDMVLQHDGSVPDGIAGASPGYPDGSAAGR